MPTKSPAKLLGLLAAGFLAASALTTSIIIAPPSGVHAEAVVPGAPVGSFADLVDQVMPAVISVQVKFANAAAGPDDMMPEMPGMPNDNPLKRFFDQMPRGPEGGPDGRPNRGGMGVGSGFIISTDGYAVTNNHVVQGADEVSVKLQDGTEHTAKVIGTDPKTDLALIKFESTTPLKAVRFAEGKTRVGDWVVAVGNPFGLGGTVTTGIVSAMGRDIGSGPYDDFLQIDASINKGNSGGPAFNLNGEVVGVNTAIFSPSGGSVGIGFAIPASTAQEVVASLKDGGSVTRGWLGVRIQPVTTDIADSMGMAEAKGAIVSEVTADSPALKGGLKTGDTILTLDDAAIADARDLSRKVARVKPGKSVKIEIVRDGKPETVTLEIGKMPADKMASAEPAVSEKTKFSEWGLRLAPATDGAGVTVTDVEAGSLAAGQGIKSGDIILEIAGAEVQTPADVKNALKAAKGKVLMLVKTGDDQRFVALPVAKG